MFYFWNNKRSNNGEIIVSNKDLIVEYIAGENLIKNTVVYLEDGKIYALDNKNIDKVDKAIGIVIENGNLGNNLSIKVIGELSDTFWSWNLNNPIFVGTEGLLTQIEPTSGFILQIAFPITSTKIFVEKKLAILL